MKKIFAIILLLPILLTGCLEIFFAAPMELGGGGGWEAMGRIDADGSQVNMPLEELVFTFGPDGSAYCFYTNTSSGYIKTTTGNAFWSQYDDPDPGSASDMICNDAGELFLSYHTPGGVYIIRYTGPAISTQLTNISAASCNDTAFALNESGSLLFAYSVNTTLHILRQETSSSFISNFYTNCGSTIFNLHLMSRTTLTDVLACFQIDSSGPRTLLRTTYTGNSPSFIDDPIFSGVPAQGALYNPDNDTVYTTCINNQNLHMRQINAGAAAGTFWSDTPSTVTNISNVQVHMAQYRNNGTMYLGYKHLSGVQNGYITILKYDNGWRQHAGPSPERLAGPFKIAVNPRDGNVWMVGVVSNMNSAQYELRSWRYVE